MSVGVKFKRLLPVLLSVILVLALMVSVTVPASAATLIDDLTFSPLPYLDSRGFALYYYDTEGDPTEDDLVSIDFDSTITEDNGLPVVIETVEDSSIFQNYNYFRQEFYLNFRDGGLIVSEYNSSFLLQFPLACIDGLSYYGVPTMIIDYTDIDGYSIIQEFPIFFDFSEDVFSILVFFGQLPSLSVINTITFQLDFSFNDSSTISDSLTWVFDTFVISNKLEEYYDSVLEYLSFFWSYLINISNGVNGIKSLVNDFLVYFMNIENNTNKVAVSLLPEIILSLQEIAQNTSNSSNSSNVQQNQIDQDRAEGFQNNVNDYTAAVDSIGRPSGSDIAMDFGELTEGNYNAGFVNSTLGVLYDNKYIGYVLFMVFGYSILGFILFGKRA